MATFKLQKPLVMNGNNIYPLTTVDQVRLDDGSKLSSKYITVNVSDEETGIVPYTNADQLGGKPASEYALKEDTVLSVNGIEPDENGNITISASDVGAMSSNYEAPVDSVNGKMGAVNLTAADVGALASSYKSDVDSLIRRWNVKTNANVCANVDNPAQTGFFHCDTTTAGTKPSTHGELLHITEDSKWSEHQLFFTSGDQIWHRRRNNNGTANSAAWSAWKRIMPVQDIYPVGSIYLSVNSTSPASLFGGTWTQLKDRFLLGAGNSYSNGATGGAATHTLSVNEMPSHSHTFTIPVTTISNPGGGAAYQLAQSETARETFDSINAAGGGQAHNNMPPYLVVYMWKRVS